MLSKRIGCCLGKIAQVTYSQTSYIIKFESDDEIFDILTFEKGDRQLNSLSELLFKTPTHSSSPSDWVGTRVNLFFGPKLYSHSNEALLYGIGKEDFYMKAKKLEPITIEDIVKYRQPNNLMYNPSGTVLVFSVQKADAEKNCKKKYFVLSHNAPPVN